MLSLRKTLASLARNSANGKRCSRPRAADGRSPAPSRTVSSLCLSSGPIRATYGCSLTCRHSTQPIRHLSLCSTDARKLPRVMTMEQVGRRSPTDTGLRCCSQSSSGPTIPMDASTGSFPTIAGEGEGKLCRFGR